MSGPKLRRVIDCAGRQLGAAQAVISWTSAGKKFGPPVSRLTLRSGPTELSNLRANSLGECAWIELKFPCDHRLRRGSDRSRSDRGRSMVVQFG